MVIRKPARRETAPARFDVPEHDLVLVGLRPQADRQDDEERDPPDDEVDGEAVEKI